MQPGQMNFTLALNESERRNLASALHHAQVLKILSLSLLVGYSYIKYFTGIIHLGSPVDNNPMSQTVTANLEKRLLRIHKIYNVIFI